MNEYLKRIKFFVVAAIKKGSMDLSEVHEDLRSVLVDKDFTLKYLVNNENNFKYLPDNLRSDSDVCLAFARGLLNNRFVLDFPHDFIKQIPEFVIEKNRELALILVEISKGLILLSSLNGFCDYKKDKTFVLEVVKKVPSALEFIPEDFKKDEEILLALIEAGRFNIPDDISSKLSNNKKFILKAVRVNGLFLRVCSDKFKKNKKIVEAAIQQNLEAFKFVSEKLKKNKKILKLFNQLKQQNKNEVNQEDKFETEKNSYIYPDLSTSTSKVFQSFSKKSKDNEPSLVEVAYRPILLQDLSEAYHQAIFYLTILLGNDLEVSFYLSLIEKIPVDEFISNLSLDDDISFDNVFKQLTGCMGIEKTIFLDLFRNVSAFDRFLLLYSSLARELLLTFDRDDEQALEKQVESTSLTKYFFDTPMVKLCDVSSENQKIPGFKLSYNFLSLVSGLYEKDVKVNDGRIFFVSSAVPLVFFKILETIRINLSGTFRAITHFLLKGKKESNQVISEIVSSCLSFEKYSLDELQKMTSVDQEDLSDYLQLSIFGRVLLDSVIKQSILEYQCRTDKEQERLSNSKATCQFRFFRENHKVIPDSTDRLIFTINGKNYEGNLAKSENQKSYFIAILEAYNEQLDDETKKITDLDEIKKKLNIKNEKRFDQSDWSSIALELGRSIVVFEEGFLTRREVSIEGIEIDPKKSIYLYLDASSNYHVVTGVKKLDLNQNKYGLRT